MRRPEKAGVAFLDDRGLFERKRVPQITKKATAGFCRDGEYTPAVSFLLMTKENENL